MSHDPILRLLGLAKKAGRLEIGEEPVGGACRAKQARLVLLARDAAPNTRRRCAHFGETGGVLWLETPFTKAELGAILGRTSCAMLALTDAGFAASAVEKLAARDPDKYGPAARQLRTKADRVLQRQREQRQHEKNMRSGRKKPWAAPAGEALHPPRGTGEGQTPPKPRVPPASRREQPPPERRPAGTQKPARRPKDGPAYSPGERPGRSAKVSGRSGPAGRRLTGRFRKP